MKKISLLVASMAALSLLALSAAPAAVAKDGDILRRGVCTGASTSKIKLSEENGRIEVEFEVDQNRNGVRWNVVIRQNGRSVAQPRARHARAERLVRSKDRAAEPRRYRHVRRDRDPVGRDVPGAGVRFVLDLGRRPNAARAAGAVDQPVVNARP